MSIRYIIYLCSRIFFVLAVLMAIPILISLLYRDGCALAFLIPSVMLFMLGLLGVREKPKKGTLFAKEGFAVVTLIWLFFTLFFMNWLGTCIFVLVTFAVNLRLKRGVGLGVGVGFWGVCEGWSFWVIMNMKWAFVAPTNNMTLRFNISKLTFQPAVQGESILMYAWVGVVYNILWLAALVAVILLLTPGYQFPFVKQRQNRFTD